MPGNAFDALARAVLSYVDRASKKVDSRDRILDRVDTIPHATKQHPERFELWSNNPTTTGAPGKRQAYANVLSGSLVPTPQLPPSSSPPVDCG